MEASKKKQEKETEEKIKKQKELADKEMAKIKVRTSLTLGTPEIGHSRHFVMNGFFLTDNL